MAPVKKEQKTVLLLSPHRLLKDHRVLASLHILKSPGNLEYKEEELNGAELRKHYATTDKSIKDILAWFTTDGQKEIKDEIKKRFALQKGGVAFEAYAPGALARKLHELFDRLKPLAQQLKWYHKTPGEKGSFKTAPCTLQAVRPGLQFNVVQEEGGLQVVVTVVLDGKAQALDTFRRFHFLLEQNNTYYLLGYKDYQTLEWLANSDPSQFSRHPQELVERILVRLEADYAVRRNNLFQKNEVEVLPQNRVLLSEISQQFLVLTPQWTYDGFLVEGAWKPTVDIVQHGQTYTIQRNKEAEQAFVQLLESLHDNFRKQLNGYYYLSFAEAQKKQWFLKVYHRLLELDIQVIGMDMLQHFRYSPHKVTAVAVLQEQEKKTVTLRLQIYFGKEEVPLAELQKMMQAGQRAVLLKDGSLGVLDDAWQQQYGPIIRHGKITGNQVQVPRWLAFTEQDANAGMQVLKPVILQSWWQKWARWQQGGEEVVYAVPATVQATLRPYQHKGFEWMLLLAEAGAGACLADDMGLGKTLQTICLLAYLTEQQPGAQHLIVCPSSLIYNWQQELQKFVPHLPVLVYHGAGRNVASLQATDHRVVITSYGTMRADVEALGAVDFQVIVADESHTIKNPASQAARAAGQLQGQFRLALSGTPVMNNTFDLYAQLNFVLPGLFGTREFFKREYADAIDQRQDADKIQALKHLTAPFMLRRTKEQVAADLPAKTDMILWCDMSAPQKELYESIKESIRSSVFLNIKEQGLGKSKLALLQGMLKLRQVCNSPLLLPAAERTCSDSIKTDLLLEELLNNLQGHKVLVFSQFTSMLDLLGAKLQEHHMAYYHFDGQTPPAKRAEMVANFQEAGNTVPVFLISLKAGNAGLNLTAADYVFLFDPWWNTAVQQQAIDRTHRIGQTKNVFAYKMICRDTIEEKIIALQQRKQQLADDLVSAEEGFVKALTEEDIAYLFS